ncbi:MAG: O-antigen polymerase, partial [Planctomycetota bacterium]
RTALQAGEFEWRRGQIEVAQARFVEAAQADRWAIEPRERMAEVSLQRWRTSHRESDFEESVQRWEVLADSLPFSSRPNRRLGQAWLSKFEKSHDRNDARKSAESFAAAVERYPHHAGLLAEWAIACEVAGLDEKAREVARRALRQDDINRQAGHSDKYLESDLRSRMDRLAGPAGGSEAN